MRTATLPRKDRDETILQGRNREGSARGVAYAPFRAAVAAFLASDDASGITGQTIYPDGGRLVLNYTVLVAAA